MSSGVPKMSFARKMSSGVPKINLTRFYQQDVVKWIFYCGTDEKYRARCVLRASDLPNDKWDMEKAAVMGLTICSTQEYIISVAANGLIHDRAWRNVGTITIDKTSADKKFDHNIDRKKARFFPECQWLCAAFRSESCFATAVEFLNLISICS
ncbi:uncharacterized protein LOC116850682 isoform X3 [Odontomachus brunneus]|uniref:uncharacterized protein LOC116850682 isoform X3 n=1 Tax=Odontomachus brunneus TaxID=486640 RepID=UPI0013F2A141|nr:uncharacterized protein LOC116850682 isoform X3 [Odontomachus brunneus]